MNERTSTERAEALTEAQMQELEARYDPEVRFRPLPPALGWMTATALFVLSCYHFYTAGYGIPQATTHRGTHLAFTLGLIFLSFVAFGKPREPRSTLLTPLGLPLVDWILAIAGVVSAMYVPWIFNDLAFRVGDPLPIDVLMGTILIVVLLEATRRAMGWPLPIIALLFIAYAYFGQSMPGVLTHPGADWRGIVNHLYLTSQGIYGTALGVISTYVFHFVLFGVLATRIGLGQLFIDLASSLAGRYAGGPAKVSVLSSALLGSISGSSIANTVTTGSLTIPAMIRIGYPRHFAAAVEAASSTGGQITPPVMGAVAFLMIEYLGLPLTTILTAALVPAFMHFFGVLVQVHLEARRRGLRGLTQGGVAGRLDGLQGGLADHATALRAGGDPAVGADALPCGVLGHRLVPSGPGDPEPRPPRPADRVAGNRPRDVGRLRRRRQVLARRDGRGSAGRRHHRRRHADGRRLQDRLHGHDRRRRVGRERRRRARLPPVRGDERAVTDAALHADHDGASSAS